MVYMHRLRLPTNFEVCLFQIRYIEVVFEALQTVFQVWRKGGIHEFDFLYFSLYFSANLTQCKVQ